MLNFVVGFIFAALMVFIMVWFVVSIVMVAVALVVELKNLACAGLRRFGIRQSRLRLDALGKVSQLQETDPVWTPHDLARAIGVPYGSHMIRLTNRLLQEELITYGESPLGYHATPTQLRRMKERLDFAVDVAIAQAWTFG